MRTKMTKARALAIADHPEDHEDDELRSAVARLRESVEKGSGGYNEVQYLKGRLESLQAALTQRDQAG